MNIKYYVRGKEIDLDYCIGSPSNPNNKMEFVIDSNMPSSGKNSLFQGSHYQSGDIPNPGSERLLMNRKESYKDDLDERSKSFAFDFNMKRSKEFP